MGIKSLISSNDRGSNYVIQGELSIGLWPFRAISLVIFFYRGRIRSHDVGLFDLFLCLQIGRWFYRYFMRSLGFN